MNKFNIYVIPCKQGQKKDGVQHGGIEICKNMDLDYKLISYDNRKSIYDNWNNVESYLSNNLIKNDNTSLFLGGDHSLIVPIFRHYLNTINNDDLFLIYIDAHADINTIKSSKSGNYHGMPVSFLLNLNDINNQNKKLLNTSHIFYIGLDDVEPQEWEILKNNKINYFKKDYNISKIIQNIKRKIKSLSSNPKIYISFDVDVLDSKYLDSTGYPSINKNRLKPDDIIKIINSFKTNLIGLDIMEFNPYLGDKNKSLDIIKYIINSI